jgi:3-oxoadipate enol-lactonase
MWADQIDMLAPFFRVLRYDTRGHGRTAATPGPYSLDLLADDLEALLDALGIAKAHFVGLSMGGMIGQVCALKYQSRFDRLVLCDTTSFYAPAARPVWMERIRDAQRQGMASLVKPTLERWFTPEFRARRPDVMDKFGECIAATSLDGYAACSEALLDINVTAQLRNVRLPTRIIVGACDVGTPVAMARGIHENLPGSDLIVIEDAAHFPNIEQTEAFNRALIPFLREEGGVR